VRVSTPVLELAHIFVLVPLFVVVDLFSHYLLYFTRFCAGSLKLFKKYPLHARPRPTLRLAQEAISCSQGRSKRAMARAMARRPSDASARRPCPPMSNSTLTASGGLEQLRNCNPTRRVGFKLCSDRSPCWAYPRGCCVWRQRSCRTEGLDVAEQ